MVLQAEPGTVFQSSVTHVIVKNVGFDNVRVRELEGGREYVCHVSWLTSYKPSKRVRKELIREWALNDRFDDELRYDGRRGDMTCQDERPLISQDDNYCERNRDEPPEDGRQEHVHDRPRPLLLNEKLIGQMPRAR